LVPLNPQLKNLHNSHVIIQTLNTTFLRQHYMHKFIDSSKYSYISIHDGHGLMMMYDIHMHLNSFNTTISDGSKYLARTFNINTQKKINCMCV
jgi:hypothetical protein